MFKKYKKMGQWLMLISITLFIPQLANATDLFSVPSTDLSKQLFLDVLFPSDLGTSPLAHVMLVFNSVALMLGGVLAAYTLILGTMQTAHDGEMLGKKWSSMWIPIRTAIGTMMLLPAAGGFCAAQVLVLWCVSQGVGFADKMWDSYSVNNNQNIAVAGTPNASSIGNMAFNLLSSNYCMNVLNGQASAFKSEDKNSSNDDPGKFTKYLDNNNTVANVKDVYNFGQQSANNMSVWDRIKDAFFNPTSASASQLLNACGSLSYNINSSSNNSLQLSVKSIDTEAFSMGKVFGSSYTGLDTTGSSNSSPLVSSFDAIYQANANAVNTLDQTMAQLADKMYQGDSVDVNSVIKTAILTYQSTVRESTASFSNNTSWSEFKETMNAQGWLMAGSWYINIAKYQGLIAQATNDLPVVTSFEINKAVFNNNEYYAKMVNFYNNLTAIEKNSPYAIQQVGQQITKDAGQIAAGEPNVEKYNLSKFIPIDDFVSSIITDLNSSTASTDPISVAISIGNSLSTIVSGAMVAIIPVSYFAPALGSFGEMLLTPLLIFGVTLSTVIPFTPYVMWLGVVTGWMIICIEAVIGAPLWVVTHLHPDGEGAVGRGGAGYGMVLSLSLRPSLMVLGLICSMLILPILINIVNVSFGPTFVAVAVSSNGLGLLQAIGIIAIYTTLLMTIVKKSFSLIHVIPDEIMKWLGVNPGSSMASHANEVSSAVAQAQGVQIATQAASKIGGVGNDVKNLKDRFDRWQQDKAKEGSDNFNKSLGGMGTGKSEGNIENQEDGGLEANSGLSTADFNSPVDAEGGAEGGSAGEATGDTAGGLMANAQNLMTKNPSIDLSAKGNKQALDNFNKLYPTAEHKRDANSDVLSEMKTRSGLFAMQLEKMNTTAGGTTGKAFESEKQKAIDENKMNILNINNAINQSDQIRSTIVEKE